MKKHLFLALLAIAAETGHAQGIKAGTVSLGGSVGYYHSSSTQSASFNNVNTTNPSTTPYTSKYTSSQFNLTPSVGYFVADNFAIGAMLSYNAHKQTSSSSLASYVLPEMDPSTSVRIGLYAQYYKMLGEQFGLIGTLGGGYQTSKDYSYSSSYAIVETKASGYYASLTPGIVFFPISKLGLSASIGSLGYNHLSYDYPTSPGTTAPTNYENKTNTFEASFGLSQLLFGANYYFGRE